MNRIVIIVLLFVFGFVSCDEPPLEKPEKLLNEKKMVEMLADIHTAEATFQVRRHSDSLLLKSTSADFYYSILDKYQVTDSVFEKSFVYYASFPKDFEKMYRKVMNKLNEKEQEFSGRKNDLLDFDEQE